MARISPSPGQKIIYLLFIIIGVLILYLDINTNSFKKVKYGFDSFKISSYFFIRSLSINPIIYISNQLQTKDKLIKENNELKMALDKSYLERYLILKNSKFFNDELTLNKISKESNFNRPYHVAKIKDLDPNIFYCCDKHRMYIQLISESKEDLTEGVVFNSSGIIGHIIYDDKYKEVMMFTDIFHSLPIKNISEDFFCNAKGSGKADYIICNYNPLVLNKKIELGQRFLTSGLGGIYPEDIEIGILDDIEIINSNNTNLKIKLLTDPLDSNLFGVINF